MLMGKLSEGIYVGGYWELSNSSFSFIIDTSSPACESVCQYVAAAFL